MGGTSSKAVANVLNEIAINASMRTIQECSASASQSQLLNIKSSGLVFASNITMKQGVQVDSTCLSSVNKRTQLISDISNQVAQWAEAQGPGVWSALGASRSEVATNVKNRFAPVLNMDTIQRSVTAAAQGQTANIEGGTVILGNVTQEQTAKIVAKSIVKDDKVAAVINDMSNTIVAKSKATTTDPIANIIDSLGSALGKLGMIGTIFIYMIPILIAIVVIAGIVAGVKSMKKSNTENNDAIPSDGPVLEGENL